MVKEKAPDEEEDYSGDSDDEPKYESGPLIIDLNLIREDLENFKEMIVPSWLGTRRCRIR